MPIHGEWHTHWPARGESFSFSLRVWMLVGLDFNGLLIGMFHDLCGAPYEEDDRIAFYLVLKGRAR
jgi:hypothetical protein